VSLLLLWSGAQLGALADITANAAGYLTLEGHATAENEQDREYIPGGEGRHAYQPYRRRALPELTAVAHGTLTLTGHATAHVQPAVVRGGALPKPTERIRPPEEEREFRILARAKGKLTLAGSATAYTRVLAAAHGELSLAGHAEVVSSWPDDTAELIAIMLMVDQEAA
jgi:hypothetical protein